MENITTKIVDNPYITTSYRLNGNLRYNVTIDLIEEYFKKNKNSKLNKKKFFYTCLQCSSCWKNDKKLNLFKFISTEVISQIREKKCYFLFDASGEGFSPIDNNWNFFPILYHTAESHNVDPSQIIFISSNLKDEDNIKKYCTDQNKKPINVFAFPMFEYTYENKQNANMLLNSSILNTKTNFKDKYFSSLSRRNRSYRTMGTFMLCQSLVKNKALISHDKIVYEQDIKKIKKLNFSQKQIKRWVKSLPLIIDHDNFDENWAAYIYKFDHIHNQTIFQIVNETHVENFNNTSLFYSEKTFRPISCFQPFLIYGQKGCNQYLQNLGYKIYADWFDLSFDAEDDNILRYKKLLAIVEDTCKYLDSLNRDQQIEWKYKNKTVLEHNFKIMNRHSYTVFKFKPFMLKLEGTIEE